MLHPNCYYDSEDAKRHSQIITQIFYSSETPNDPDKENKNNSTLYCAFCKLQTHEKQNCSLLVRRQSLLKQYGQVCNYCYSVTHNIQKCPVLLSLRCNYCQRKGHTMKRCPYLHQKTFKKLKETLV